MVTTTQNSTCHWQTQTFSHEVLSTKDQNFGTLYPTNIKNKVSFPTFKTALKKPLLSNN